MSDDPRLQEAMRRARTNNDPNVRALAEMMPTLRDEVRNRAAAALIGLVGLGTEEETRAAANTARRAAMERAFELFRQAHHGRDPIGAEELAAFLAEEQRAGRLPPGPIDPYSKDH